LNWEYIVRRNRIGIAIERAGVFVIKRTAGGDKRRQVAAPIKVRSIGTRLSDRTTLVEIGFKTVDGDYCLEMLEFSYLQPGRRNQIKIRLGDKGYKWPQDARVSNEIIKQLAATDPKRRFKLVSAPGWYESEFVLPDKVFSPPERGTDFRIDPNADAHLGAFVRGNGSLKDWKRTVAKPATKSSCMRVAIGAAFAAPLLRLMGMDSFAINWFSNTSDGKTAMLFIAASVAGLIGAEGLPGWGDSEAGIEDQARGHRDCLLPLDESGDGSSKISLIDKARMLAFMIARNRPRKLSTQYERAHGLQGREWRIIAQSTSETALSQAAIAAGDARLGGEEIRFMDVCASEQGSLGIIDGHLTTAPGRTDRETSKELIDQIKADAITNQGYAFREFLDRYFQDPEALSKVKAYKGQFEEKASVASSNAALRIRSNFALIWAAAAMAIDYGVLPWKKSPTFRAVEKCLHKALSEIEASKAAPQSPSGASASVLMALNEGLANADLRTIVLRKKITPGQARRRLKADGFRINGNIFLKPDRLKQWLPSQRERTILKDAEVLRTRRGDTATVEQVIAGIPGKPRYYVLDMEKLDQLLRKSRSDPRR
jgi:uncharacterized protein (DUF927 family)